MAINVVPERTINYAVTIDDENKRVGTATVDLPEITMMTDTVSGAGIAGEYESPTLGHTESITMTLNFRTPTEAAKISRPGAIPMTLRAAMQQYDSALGVTSSVPVRFVIRGINKSLTLGSLEPSAVTDSSVELEVMYLKMFINNVPVMEIDKLAFIHMVNGIDYLAKVRADLGM